MQEEAKDPVKFTQCLLDLRDKYNGILREAFFDEDLVRRTRAPEAKLLKAVNQAFATFVNENPRAAENTSLFIDNLLKKGAKELSDAQVEQTLDNVIVLFRFLQDKDFFERYYKQHFAKRLLGNKAASDEVERGVINRLRTECGYNFTAKLEGMFKDIFVSRTTNEAFKPFVAASDEHKQGLRGMDLTVKVLTSGYWPTSSNPSAHLPLELQSAVGVFTKFFNTKHSGRVLTWQTAFGSADVLGRFDKGRKHTFQVTTNYMIILLAFNDLPDEQTLGFQVIDISGNVLGCLLRARHSSVLFSHSLPPNTSSSLYCLVSIELEGAHKYIRCGAASLPADPRLR